MGGSHIAIKILCGSFFPWQSIGELIRAFSEIWWWFFIPFMLTTKPLKSNIQQFHWKRSSQKRLLCLYLLTFHVFVKGRLLCLVLHRNPEKHTNTHNQWLHMACKHLHALLTWLSSSACEWMILCSCLILQPSTWLSICKTTTPASNPRIVGHLLGLSHWA